MTNFLKIDFLNFDLEKNYEDKKKYKLTELLKVFDKVPWSPKNKSKLY